MTMVERVARAHYARTIEIVAVTRPGSPFLPWDGLPEEQRRIALAGAHAAIEAMREPTEAMLEAMNPSGRYASLVTPEAWSDAIDAALKETP